MSYLTDLRAEMPALSNYSDAEIIAYLPTYDPETFGNLTPDQARYVATNDDSQITKGFKAGIDQAQAIGGGLLAAIGDAAGMDGLKQWGVDAYSENMQEASQYAGNVEGFTDIEGTEDALDWAGYTLGNLVPSMATALAGGGISGIVGKQVAKKAATDLMAKELAAGASREAAAKAAGQLLAKRVATSQAAGAFGVSAGMGTGSIYGETEDAGVAFTHGAVAGAFDAMPIARVLGKFGLAGAAKEQVQRSVVSEVAKQGGLEAGTEALQTLVEQHAKHWVDTNGESLLADLGAVNYTELVDAAAAGALGGGTMGVGTGLLSRKPMADANERIQAAGEEAAAAGGDALDQAVARGKEQANSTPKAATADSAPDWSQYDSPAHARSQPSGRKELSDIDRMIRSAESLGFDDEVVRLTGARRYFAQAEALRAEGQHDQAARLAEKGNAIVQDVMEQPAVERADQFPAPYVASGEVVGGEVATRGAQEAPTGAVIEGELSPQRMGAQMAPGLERKVADNRLTDQGIIYGQEPEDVTAQREQRHADHFNALYGQEGATPVQPDPAVEGELLNPGQIVEPERMLPDQSTPAPRLPNQSMSQLPPGEHVIYGNQERPERQFSPVNPLYDGVGRNIIERQAQMPTGIEHQPGLTQQQFIQLEAQYRQIIRKPVSKRTNEEKAAVEVVKRVRAGELKLSSSSVVEPAADNVARPAPRIEDFGEVLPEARKHIASFEKAISADVDVKSVPLSKSFPQPDYEKLAASGVDKRALAAVAHVRARVGAKPRARYKVARWAQQAGLARDIAKTLLSSDQPFDVALDRLAASGAAEGNRLLPELLSIAPELNGEQIKQLGNYALSKRHFLSFGDQQNVDKYTVSDITRKAGFGGMGRESHFDTLDEAKVFIREQLASGAPVKGKAPKFDIWTERGKEGVFIGKKIAARKYIELKKVETVPEARAYLRDNAEALAELLKKKKQVRAVRRTDNSPRKGPDYRGGADVTPEQFSDAFGFRGVQFGNWVEGDKRQQDLNEAYDGLMDLASIIDVPPKALSLDGQLGLAFGARGRGGKQPAAAHYEPKLSVINLTKKSGAGSLAHEWWHAVDNYFAGIESADSTGYLTEHQRPARIVKMKDGTPTFSKATDADFPVRAEVYSAFRQVTAAIQNETKLAERSAKLDTGRTKDYWSTVREMTARSFERYVIGRLDESGHSNDYLANIVSEADHTRVNEVLGDSEPYAYPLATEMAAVNRAYDHLFDTIDTRETDRGVAMFSRGKDAGGMTARQVGEVVSRIAGNLKGAQVSVVATEKDLPAAILKQADEEDATGQIKAVLHGDQIFIVADRMESAAAVEEAILHEGRHHGGRKLFGSEFTAAYNGLWMKLGGTEGLRARAKEAGIADAMGPYFKTAEDLMKSGEITSSRRNEYLVDEFVAHVAGQQAYETLPARIKRAIKEFIGAIRQILRKAGFAELPELSDSDMAYLVRQTGKAAAGRKVTKPHFMAVSEEDQMNLFFSDLADQLDAAPAMERAALSRVPGDAPVLETDGDGIEYNGSLREMSEQAKAYASEHFTGSTVVNKHHGDEIIISMKGVKHTLRGAQPDLVKTVAITPEILERSVYIGNEPEKRGDPNVLRTHFFGIKVSVDGRVHDVVAVVKEHRDGKRYYDHSIESKEKGAAPTEQSNGSRATPSETDSTISDSSIEGSARFSRTADSFEDLSGDQSSFLDKIGTKTTTQRIKDRISEAMDSIGLKTRQGMVDKYASLLELDKKAHGDDVVENRIKHSSWVLSKMSHAADGALSAMLSHGRIRFDEGVVEIQEGSHEGLLDVLQQLGTNAEIERFMGWIAANRSKSIADQAQAARDRAKKAKAEKANLKSMLGEPGLSPAQTRKLNKAIKDADAVIQRELNSAEIDERLFTQGEIEAGVRLNTGTTAKGEPRSELYKKVFAEFQQHRDDVLAIAEKAGIITPQNRKMWRDEFYVPFYRVMEEETTNGPRISKGLSRQEAYKRLKGGKQDLNDLLENTLMNFHHLLSASLKNNAARQALENAEKVGVATRTTESKRNKKASTYVLDKGKPVWFDIEDDLVFQSLTALTDVGANTFSRRILRGFKRTFTSFTTISPQFIVANTLRDSLQAIAIGNMSYNAFSNMYQGAMAYGGPNSKSKVRADMLASGAAFSFGHIYGAGDIDALKAEMQRKMKGARIIESPKDVKQMLRKAWDYYSGLGDTAENSNRAAIYEQNLGKGKLYAAFQSRDLMDFSSQGAWPAIKFLTDVVPFLNARLVGLDRLYRGGVKPTFNVIRHVMGGPEASATDRQAAQRFAIVAGALTAATIALYLANKDDERFKELEEWERDGYWHFWIGDAHYSIPKPFEVGAIATVAERALEQVADDSKSGKLFAERMGHILADTFAFNPIPQATKPLFDLYSNKDSFTGRAIENMAVRRLSAVNREKASTTEGARFASMLMDGTLGKLSDDLVFSPIQIDYLVRGYLGWVGSMGAATIDVMAKSAQGIEQPEKGWTEYQPIRRFYSNSALPKSFTRYGTEFYGHLKEVGTIYSDIRYLREMGKDEEAVRLLEQSRDKLRYRQLLNRAQKRLSKLNQRMSMVKRNRSLSAEEKRRQIDSLTLRRNAITKRIVERLEGTR